MDGREFLEVAETLLADKRQAYVRTSIGRFYYAAYLETRSFCESYLGLVRTARSSEHQEVPALIARIDPEIANELKWIRKYRNNADYDIHLSEETISLQVEDCRAFARRVIAALDVHAERLERERAASSDEESDPTPPSPSR